MERISRRQLALLGGIMILDSTLVSVPAQMIQVARQDAWLGFFFAGSLIALALWCLARVSDRFPNSDLFDALVKRYPVLGRAIAGCYILFFFFILMRDIRMVSDFSNVSLLPKTPLLAIAMLVLWPIILMARGGVEIIARMNDVFAPALIVVILSLPILVLNGAEFQHLSPILAKGLVPIGQSAWYVIPYIGEILCLPFLVSGRQFRFRDGLAGLGIGLGLLLVLTLANIFVLGPFVSAVSMYPNWETIRQIRVTDFLDRLDLFLVGVYLPTLLTKIAVGLYMTVHGLKRVIPSLSARPLSTAMGLLALGVSFWFFQTGLQVLAFNRVLPFFSLSVHLFIPIGLALFMHPKAVSTRRTPSQD